MVQKAFGSDPIKGQDFNEYLKINPVFNMNVD
jgi:hypothetical protein